MRTKQQVDVCAHGLDENGCGVGRAGDWEVRVRDLLPGERARAIIEHTSGQRPAAWGRIARRLGPLAPERVAPSCPAFGRCGGCSWQHLAYGAQLGHKRDRVARALAEVGIDTPVAAAVAAPQVTGYRSRAKYVVGPGPILGAYEPRSHRVVGTAGCSTVTPAIDRAVRILGDELAATGLPVYDERRRTGVLRYAIARSDAAGAVLLAVVTRQGAALETLGRAAARLVAGGVAGVLWLGNDTTAGAIAVGTPLLLAGRATLVESFAAVDVDVGIGEFLQVNRDQAARVYAAAIERLEVAPGMTAVDLYCGVGAIAFSLARAGARVLGVDRDGPAIAAAERAAQRAGLAEQVRFCCAAASELARVGAELDRGRPDAVVVNPPRKGLDPEARTALLQLAPAAIAYLSCDPRSLARDTEILTAAGYGLESVEPYDFMPGTPQVETLAICRRAGRARRR